MASKLNDALPASVPQAAVVNIKSAPSATATANSSSNKKSLDEKLAYREQWSSKLDFILSCVGYAIGILLFFNRIDSPILIIIYH